MILAAFIVLIVVCSIWFVIGKSEKEDEKFGTENYVKIEPKEENKGTNDNG